MKRIAFDLDETLGIPIIDGVEIVGFRLRDGCKEVLEKLHERYQLCLWTVSNRSYLDKALSFGLKDYFSETYAWDELPVVWKDVRKINADFLIDDSPHHREEAAKFGIESRYIIIAAYGSEDDNNDSLLWVKQIENILNL